MLKLYKRIDNKLHYWETWSKSGKTGIVHWGKVGQRGNVKEVKSTKDIKFREEIKKEVTKKIEEGYSQLELENHKTILIEYEVEGMGTEEDLKKRYKLQDRMDETLGWLGLGSCDGGSIGSGTMEVCCFVVDFEIAKKEIENDLSDTEFENYTKIFDGNG